MTTVEATTESGLDEFIQDSRQQVGQPATDIPEGRTVADLRAISAFCMALADVNPLYTDPAYGAVSKYNSMIAPPAFVIGIRTPTSAAAFEEKSYGLVKLVSGAAFEWVDVVRLGDGLASDVTVVDVKRGQPVSGRNTAEVVTQATYRNSYGGLIGTGTGTVRLIPFEPGDPLLSDREIYSYSDEEIARMEEDLKSKAPPRGRHLRYWNDVSIGEKLATLCKPHLSVPEFQTWVRAEAKPLPAGSLTYFEMKRRPGRARVNPTTNWPLMDIEEMFNDIRSCEAVGVKTPASVGLQRVAIAAQAVTDWMGDDGMLHRLEVELPKFYHYGDTVWVAGEVVDKYKERLGDEMYHAVKLSLAGTNQIGETIVRGSATVYLPNPGHPVALPLPH